MRDELLGYVRALEGRDNQSRGDAVLRVLGELGVPAAVQGCPLPPVRNIVVDFRQGQAESYSIFSAHYDAVRGSPGANDNASGVAVLLGLCRRLKPPAPVKVIFFDREENWLRTPVLNMGLLGSACYVWRNRLNGLRAVYNVECCGQGDVLAIWPVKSKRCGLPAVKAVREAAAAINMSCRTANFPWLFRSSDHFSFRLRGIENALSLSMAPGASVDALERLVAGVRPMTLLAGGRPVLPEPFSFLHTRLDSSEHVAEASLESMLAVLEKLASKAASD